jgi:hyperosmotically inducible protein
MTRLNIRSCGPIVLGVSLLLTPMVGLATATPGSFVQTQKMSDDAVRDHVAYKIETNSATKKYDIRVKASNGEVTLTGTVATEAQKLEAGRLAKVDGVTKVYNNIKVDPNEDKALTDRAKGGMTRTGDAITDTWITTKVKWFYLGDDVLKGSKISVTTTNRVVTLTGTVLTEAGRKQAVALAQDTDGVTKVVDNLTIGKAK